MASKSAQKSLTTQFMSITGVNEKSAIRLLKGSSWKLEQACDRQVSDMDPHRQSFFSQATIESFFSQENINTTNSLGGFAPDSPQGVTSAGPRPLQNVAHRGGGLQHRGGRFQHGGSRGRGLQRGGGFSQNNASRGGGFQRGGGRFQNSASRGRGLQAEGGSFQNASSRGLGLHRGSGSSQIDTSRDGGLQREGRSSQNDDSRGSARRYRWLYEIPLKTTSSRSPERTATSFSAGPSREGLEEFIRESEADGASPLDVNTFSRAPGAPLPRAPRRGIPDPPRNRTPSRENASLRTGIQSNERFEVSQSRVGPLQHPPVRQSSGANSIYREFLDHSRSRIPSGQYVSFEKSMQSNESPMASQSRVGIPPGPPANQPYANGQYGTPTNPPYENNLASYAGAMNQKLGLPLNTSSGPWNGYQTGPPQSFWLPQMASYNSAYPYNAPQQQYGSSLNAPWGSWNGYQPGPLQPFAPLQTAPYSSASPYNAVQQQYGPPVNAPFGPRHGYQPGPPKPNAQPESAYYGSVPPYNASQPDLQQSGSLAPLFQRQFGGQSQLSNVPLRGAPNRPKNRTRSPVSGSEEVKGNDANKGAEPAVPSSLPQSMTPTGRTSIDGGDLKGLTIDLSIETTELSGLTSAQTSPDKDPTANAYMTIDEPSNNGENAPKVLQESGPHLHVKRRGPPSYAEMLSGVSASAASRSIETLNRREEAPGIADPSGGISQAEDHRATSVPQIESSTAPNETPTAAAPVEPSGNGSGVQYSVRRPLTKANHLASRHAEASQSEETPFNSLDPSQLPPPSNDTSSWPTLSESRPETKRGKAKKGTKPEPSSEPEPKPGIGPEAENETKPEAVPGQENAISGSDFECEQNANPKANSYFASNGSAPLAKEKDNLGKLFEKYRDSTDEEDKTGVNGTMRYLQDLGLNLESGEILVPLEIVQAPALAEMSKEGFVEGWKSIGADTIPKQKAYVAGQLKQLSVDMALFKRVYRHTFVCSREPGQKALPLENALVYWEMIFSEPGKPWITGPTNWTNLWIEFLKANWTKTVNKDMWNQTFEFFQKTMQDETLSFWSEDGAWPGVIDEFVAYVKEKRGDLPDTMETD